MPSQAPRETTMQNEHQPERSLARVIFTDSILAALLLVAVGLLAYVAGAL